MAQTPPITSGATVGEWLAHPSGGPLLREMLAKSNMDESVLGPARGIPLGQLVALSQGRLSQDVVDDLVSRANVGADTHATVASSAWSETIVPGRFQGKTIIVTGAGSGIGRATASRLAREGGRVVAVDLAADRLDAFAAAHPGSEIVAVAADITAADAADRIVAAAGSRIDGLANVAGINDDFSPAHETTDAMWDRVIAINLTSSFKLMRAVLPAMLAAGRGSIVNITSEAGLRGNASGNAYTVSKHGVIGLTRSAAFMYGPQGIRVNAVAPGGVATGIPMAAHISEFGMGRLRPFHSSMPAIAVSEQLAASITFLLSDDGTNINGAILPSDGGWSVQ